MTAYYNEHEPYAAAWLRNLMRKGLIADGEVDTRSIVDVSPDDLRGFTQCHFFAGIGGWSHALRLAGWPDDCAVWTGSCPCQPFSVAGKGLGADDPRHLWPHFHRLIAACKPPVVFGEQVSGAAGYGWLDGVRSDLARENYACEGFDIPACAVDAPHIRSRLYWCATRGSLVNDDVQRRSLHIQRDARQGLDGARQPSDRSAGDTGGEHEGDMADSKHFGLNGGTVQGSMGTSKEESGMFQSEGLRSAPSFWDDHVWLTGADGKSRRAQPGLSLLAHGIPARVGRLRAYGNAIVPQLAAEVISAFMDTEL